MISKTGGYSRATVPCRNGSAVTYGRKVLNTLNSSRLHKRAQHVNGPAQISHVFVFHSCMGQNSLPCPKLSQKTKQRTHARSTCQWHLFWTLFYHITTKFMKSNVCITIHQIHKNGSRAEEVWGELSATWSRGILGY